MCYFLYIINFLYADEETICIFYIKSFFLRKNNTYLKMSKKEGSYEMLDFVDIVVEEDKKGHLTVEPRFKVKPPRDLMIRGNSFYAIFDECSKTWSTDEFKVQQMVDFEIYSYVDQNPELQRAKKKTMEGFSSNKWTEWQKYCKSLPNNYHDLDSKIIFANQKLKKTDYATFQLPYPICSGLTESYDRMMSVLYEPKEREKIEWAIGAIISGDSRWIQKFMVLYGGPGTGKSTVLNLVQNMFDGYYSLLDAKALVTNSSFGLESLKNNSLIAIQHDGDLSKIDDNSKLNSVVSHEEMVINEKYKSLYSFRFQSFLWIGTNKPVRITDSKSGVVRRLIDVHPTGNKLSRKEYDEIQEQLKFEYSGIAQKCLDVYLSLGPNYYDKYVPEDMIMKTNDFYNFIEDNYDMFTGEMFEDGLPLNIAWQRYKAYCEDARVAYPMPMRIFRDELKNYFEKYYERKGNKYSVYQGFLERKFKNGGENESDVEEYVRSDEKTEIIDWLSFRSKNSIFDKQFGDCPAQYASGVREIPSIAWDKCETKLRDLNTQKTHYVRVPEVLVCIDFDLKDEDGQKNLIQNIKEASKWPRTYAELSKSGQGIHLYYFYKGDVAELSRIFAEDIEIKIFTGKSSLRRKVIGCNDLPIVEIHSGLPKREVRTLIKEEVLKSEKKLRELIERNLRKEIHPATKPSIDFISKILDDAYASGLKYDVTDMRPAIQNFAMNSTHQADYCLHRLSKMKFASEEESQAINDYGNAPIVFFDCEVFPNLFVICWKKQGKDQKVFQMINPSPDEVDILRTYRLIGFNNRDYDNHILYARIMGYTNEQLYKLSHQIIVEKDKNAKFREAFNLSYTDIYDFLSASNKKSLKKWEIQLGIHHQELNLPWDQAVPKEKFQKVADYCSNDVIATEAVWDANQEDWLAREILAEWAELTTNDTTNACTTRIIVGDDRTPQNEFIYTDLSTIFPGYRFSKYGIPKEEYKEGAKIVKGKSIYMGEDPGEGGRVMSRPGIWYRAAVLDVASMHPSTIVHLKVFGERYTMRYGDIKNARIMIKHGDYEGAKKILPDRLHKYLKDKREAKKLANAMKTALNSAYGLTSASFPNRLKDPRNEDNIVAKHGALFMMNLQKEVEDRGYNVFHIKTDSIKIANADNEIIQFVMEYGKEYGYDFEHESTYERICLVNEAVYIAKYASSEWCDQKYGYIPENNEKEGGKWTATGTQFQVPYVFKTLFSKEPIEFEDLCEVKSVSTAMYLDFNEKLEEDLHDRRFVGKVGCFCPMKDGVGAAILERQDGNDQNKFHAVNGTKRPGKGDERYRWMESAMILNLNLKDSIDRSYYNRLVDEAVDTVNKYGDFEIFISDDQNLDEIVNVPEWCDEEEYPFTDSMFMNKPEIN